MEISDFKSLLLRQKRSLRNQASFLFSKQYILKFRVNFYSVFAKRI